MIPRSLDDLDFSREAAANGLIIFCVSVVMLFGLAAWNDFERAIDALYGYHWGRSYIMLGRAMFFINGAVFIWRLSLVARYRPHAMRTDEELPVCTVVVPAYNEGKQVLHTLRSVVNSDYPEDKLQIIAVDDGSFDDTWQWIQRAAGEFSGRIKTIRFS